MNKKITHDYDYNVGWKQKTPSLLGQHLILVSSISVGSALKMLVKWFHDHVHWAGSYSEQRLKDPTLMAKKSSQ